jgi:hypothetical protein
VVGKLLRLIANNRGLLRLISAVEGLRQAEEIIMTKIAIRPIRAGDKVVRDTATQDQGKVRLGDGAPVFGR